MPILFILLWSSGFLFGATGLQTNTPLAFMTVRLFSVFVIMGIVLLFQGRRVRLSWQEITRMSTIGLFLQGFYQFFAFNSITHGISPGLLAIILGGQPIATAIITKPSMSISQITGLIIGLLGLALTVSKGLFIGENSFIGMLCCFLALFGLTVGTILQKNSNLKQPITVNLFIQHTASFLFAVILYLLLDHHPIHWTNSFIIAVSWMVLVVSITSTILFYYLLENRVIVNFTSYLYCVPPVTALLDYFVFHHALSKTTLLGMCIVMLGLLLIHKKPMHTWVEQTAS